MRCVVRIAEGRVQGKAQVPDTSTLLPGWEEVSADTFSTIHKLGGTLADGVYTPPAPVRSPVISLQAFLQLFTDEQFQRVRELRDTDNQVYRLLYTMELGSAVNLSLPEVQAGVGLLASKDADLFPAREIARILAGQPPGV